MRKKKKSKNPNRCSALSSSLFFSDDDKRFFLFINSSNNQNQVTDFFLVFKKRNCHLSGAPSFEMTTVEGKRRKRNRVEGEAFQVQEMPPPKAPKFLESIGKVAGVAAEKGKETGMEEEEGDGKRAVVESAADVGNPAEMNVGWWDLGVEWPCMSHLHEQLLFGLGWFPFMEAGFDDFVAQNELVWDVDLWQLRDIHEIPNQ